MVYSFDIFDTLITRTVMRPTDIFWLVGQTLSKTAHSRIDPKHYRKARIRAEHQARIASRPLDDCRWDAIFRHFPELARWGVDKDYAMRAELDAERLYSRPIAENVTRVRRLMDAGEEVIFLSDMYLPGDFIRELIREQGIDCPRDRVYVSGDLGLAKHTGRLYSHVIWRYGIAPSQLRHHGDNRYADVEVPRRLGIEVEHYRGIEPTRHERLPRPRGWASIELSAMRGVARAARLKAVRDEQTPDIGAIAAGVVAPILTAYVAWVLRDARQRQIERLYFVSRDGQILHMIASVLRQEGDPECRYLYGSRQAWFLPSVHDLDDASLKWAWMKGLSRSGRDILRRLEIDEEPVLSVLAHEGFDEASLARQLDDNELERIKVSLRKTPIASILLRKVESRRMILLEYLKQEGCLDEARWALVDIGWKLNCQYSLSRILRYTRYTPDVAGYYFGVSFDHVSLEQAGFVYSFIAHNRSCLIGVLKADWIFKRSTVAVTENVFVPSDQNSVKGYHIVGARIEPLFKDDVYAEDRKSLAKIVIQAVRAYTEELVYVKVIDPASDSYRRQSVSVMKKFCLYPNYADVLSISNLEITDDPTHSTEHWNRLANPIDIWSLYNIIVDYFSGQSTHHGRLGFSWTAGSAAISKWPIRLFFIMGSAMASVFNLLRFLRISFLK